MLDFGDGSFLHCPFDLVNLPHIFPRPKPLHGLLKLRKGRDTVGEDDDDLFDEDHGLAGLRHFLLPQQVILQLLETQMDPSDLSKDAARGCWSSTRMVNEVPQKMRDLHSGRRDANDGCGDGQRIHNDLLASDE